MDTNSVPSVGQVLNERFLEPNGISQYRLAKAIGKPQATISNIILKDQGISPELAVLLGKALGTGTQYWIDVDTAYKLSKIENAEVEQLLDEQSDGALVESGGYTFTTRIVNDAILGRALRGAIIASGEIDPTERKMLLRSINEYVMYGIISVPGTEDFIEHKDDMPVNAMALFEQFLIGVGENSDAVKQAVHDARIDTYQGIGEYDIDGFERQINWRMKRSVDMRFIGELLCATSQLDDDGQHDVFDCLFSYTHDESINFPDDDDALEVFKRFLYVCEGRKRVDDLYELFTVNKTEK